MYRSLLPLAALCSLTACASMAQEDVPALVVDPTSESRVEILRIVHSALNASNVTIAADALTQESVLVIERKPARDGRGTRTLPPRKARRTLRAHSCAHEHPL
jgi:hypothetical protein